jgi:hypothetical protein
MTRFPLKNYYIYYGVVDVPLVHLSFAGLIASMFAVGLALGVTIAVGILFVIQVSVSQLSSILGCSLGMILFQITSIWRNQSGIENWIIKKVSETRLQ